MNRTLLLLQETRLPRQDCIEAIWLTSQAKDVLTVFRVDGTLYTANPVKARCEQVAFDSYVTTVTEQGRLVMIAGNSVVYPLDDFPYTLRIVTSNRIDVRLVPSFTAIETPVFFSDSKINPSVMSVLAFPLFSNYAELPDVQSYISDQRSREAINPDLAINPLSLDFLRAGEQMTPESGAWFLVQIPSQPPSVGALFLANEHQQGIFTAVIYSPFPFEPTPGLVLRREVSTAEEPTTTISRDLFKLLATIPKHGIDG